MGVALSDYGERGDRARNKMMAGSIIIFFFGSAIAEPRNLKIPSGRERNRK